MAINNSQEMSKMFCGFCGKNAKEVERLIVGPALNICNECIELSYGIIHGEEDYSHPTMKIILARLDNISTRMNIIGRQLAVLRNEKQE